MDGISANELFQASVFLKKYGRIGFWQSQKRL